MAPLTRPRCLVSEERERRRRIAAAWEPFFGGCTDTVLAFDLFWFPSFEKLTGALGLIDDEETDWKVVLINVNDPAASQYSSIEDVPEALLEMIYTYFRDKPANKALNERDPKGSKETSNRIGPKVPKGSPNK